MHELSIVMGIVEIAESETRKAGAVAVESIELEIGKLAGIQIDSLEFAWDVAVKNTVLQKAHRQIHHIPGKARCSECETEFEMIELYDACPNCGQYFSEILQGQELRVKSLVVS
ncbi:MAG: hydrogenase maturation nickel metallochaperone HypA [Saprospiraceae bacterium]|nr:hydrogenase maturation nickel metallochaperone HypA [Saprospiraceae bacterium]